MFLYICLFVLMILSLLVYLSFNAYFLGGSATLSYVVSRIKGIRGDVIVYFLWSIPYASTLVFVTSVITSHIVAKDFENKESLIYYAYPITRGRIVVSKFIAAFLLSLLSMVMFVLLEMVAISVMFRSYPPMVSVLSFGLSILCILSVVSVTTLFASLFRSSVFSALFFLITYFVALNAINFYFLVIGGDEPFFLLNNSISLLSQVYSQINLVPFGNVGYLSGVGPGTIYRDAIVLSLYCIMPLILSVVVTGRKEL